MSEEQRDDRPGTAESFSPRDAYEALQELFEGIPKTRRGQYLGHLNEIACVLVEMAGQLGIGKDTAGWHCTVFTK